MWEESHKVFKEQEWYLKRSYIYTTKLQSTGPYTSLANKQHEHEHHYTPSLPFPTRPTQNSPPPPPIAAAPQIPTNPQTPTLHPLHNPCNPCPLRIRLGRSKPIAFALAAFAASGADTEMPSSRAMNHIEPKTPRYGPGSTIVLKL